MIEVAFDVDGCLIYSGLPSSDIQAREDVRSLLIAFSNMPNVKIIVWSGSGEMYARMVARAIGITHYVNEYMYKDGTRNPDIAFDDMDVTLGKVNFRV